jgi:hypothetical protein
VLVTCNFVSHWKKDKKKNNEEQKKERKKSRKERQTIATAIENKTDDI